MSSIGFSDALRTARAQKIIDSINAGSGPGSMLFYSAPKPAKGAAVTTQTLAGALVFAEPAGTVSNGVLAFNTLADDSSVDNDCWIRWVRILDGDGVFVADGDVSEPDGTLRNADGSSAGTIATAPVTMPSCRVYAGGVLHAASAGLTEGNI
jgi:hypothetical protein